MDIIFSTVLFMGFTCSMGCGTVSMPFLLGSLLGDGGNISDSRKAITIFSIGKVVSLMLMGMLASIFGNIVLTSIEGLYPDITIWVIRIATFLLGAKVLYITVKYEFLNKNNDEVPSGCSSCSGCAKSQECGSSSEITEISTEVKTSKSYFFAGLLYATIPCGPLLTCLTYASTMNIIWAMLLLGAFGIVNSIIPVFFFASLVGVANNEFRDKSADFLKYIKFSGGLILIYASIFKV